MITSSYNTPYDTDYNLHKSNSTYFADLDIARAHYVGSLIRTGLARLNRGDEQGLPASAKQAKGEYYVALGGVSCFFQRQIEPLQAFDVFTRILSWDRKWVYIVSHIVKKGAVRPTRYVLQPWKKPRRRPGQLQDAEKDLEKHIFATSISRYVFKKGRLTINPEIVLERSRLLPPRPDGVGYPPRARVESESASTPWTPAGATDAITIPPSAAQVAEKLEERDDDAVGAEEQHDGDVDVDEEEEWTWETMERERVRGLEIAGHFDKLNDAHGELKADVALGRYGEFW
nr:uncharacterized protein CFP56_44370 [Quercus suber]